MKGHPVWQARSETAALLLGRPDLIEGRSASRTGFSPAGWRELRYWADASHACDATAAALDSLTQRALAHLPVADGTDLVDEPACCLSAADPHDAYFRIRRIDDRPGVSYLRGLLQALAVFAQEARDPLEARAYQVIPRALCSLWCDILDVPISGGLHHGKLSRSPMLQLAVHPVQRWVRGHQIFASLTQGLIWSMHRLGQAADGPPAAVPAALSRVTLLLEASAAAFRFTADFDPQHYRDTIRPSMCEPHVPKGFSGTLSSDHGFLVRQMAAMRPQLARLQISHPESYQAMSNALAMVYEDHKQVCEHFDVAQGPSLRGGLRRDAQAGPSGAEMLDRFKHRRMAMLN